MEPRRYTALCKEDDIFREEKGSLSHSQSVHEILPVQNHLGDSNIFNQYYIAENIDYG
jgi:hypothetical protein